jgi:hypothetical protein
MFPYDRNYELRNAECINMAAKPENCRGQKGLPMDLVVAANSSTPFSGF